jgi:hypothetical protein
VSRLKRSTLEGTARPAPRARTAPARRRSCDVPGKGTPSAQAPLSLWRIAFTP